MARQGHKAVALVTSMVVTIALVSTVSSTDAAAADTAPFESRFSANANGTIVSIGNMVLTCSETTGTGNTSTNVRNCRNAKAGGVYDDNGFVMVNVDADGSAYPTANSSMSTLDLPTGADVLWAGLYWGARLDAGTYGSAGSSAYNRVSFRVPGAAAYQTITADEIFGPNTSSNRAYQGFADVTGLVQRAGAGDYWTGDVVAATGNDRYAGWALTVVYAAPGLPLRNLTVFDGFNMVTSGRPQTIKVSGFQAPLSGPVDTQLSMVVYEGDPSQTGDYTKLNNTQLATAVSPGSNFFNSTDDLRGTLVTARNPSYSNMLGFDIKNLALSGTIGNGDTSATFTFSSNGDTYYPGVLATAINLYAPDFTTSSKTAQNLNGNTPAWPGDVIQYTINYANTGQDPAKQMVSHDAIPAGTSYLPGSLTLLSGPGVTGASALTDKAGDDLGEVTASGVTVRLGSQASVTGGGSLAVGGSTSYSFRVRVSPTASGTVINNIAGLDYVTGTTGIASTYQTTPVATSVVAQADLAITKTMTPSSVAYGQPIHTTLTVTNGGPNLATGVRVEDILPAGLTVDASSVTATDATGAAVSGCSKPAETLVCSLPDMAVGARITIAFTGRTASDPMATASSLTNSATVASTTADPDLTNNQAAVSTQQVAQADLAITKTSASTTVTPGQTVTYTLKVTNNGPSDAAAVRVVDQIPVEAQAVLALESIAGPDGSTCQSSSATTMSCSLDGLASGSSANVTVVARVHHSAAPGLDIINSATVSSAVFDPQPDNNTSSAQGTTGPRQADIALAKTVSSEPVLAGGSITYTVTASNLGPSDASDVVITDEVPPSIAPTAASTDRGTCQIDGQVVTCSIASGQDAAGAMPVGTTATITISGMLAVDATDATNSATYEPTDGSPDPDPGNNTATTGKVKVTAQADLAVTKTSLTQSPPAAAGETVDYDIRVVNLGPSTAPEVSLHDELPAGLTLADPAVEGLPEGADCAPSAGQTALDCQLGALPVQQPLILTVHAVATGPGVPPMAETVTASSAAVDPNEDNNTATWVLSGESQADLWIQKSVEPASLVAGGQALYTITVGNKGMNDTYAEVEDDLPAGLTFDLSDGASHQFTSSHGNFDDECLVDSQTLFCDSEVLQAADIDPENPVKPWTITAPVIVAPDLADGSTIANIATVTPFAGGHGKAPDDPSLANNTWTNIAPVVAQQADIAVTDVAWQAYQGFTDPPGEPITEVRPGSLVWLTMTFQNVGSSTAANASLRMNYDMGMANMADDANAPYVRWNDGSDAATGLATDSFCTLADAEITCPLVNPRDGSSALNPGDRSTVSMLIFVYSDAAGSSGKGWTTASTTSTETTPADASDPNADPSLNNYGEAPLTITQSLVSTPDGPKPGTNLVVSKEAAPGTLVPDASAGTDGFVVGEPFAYTITVHQPGTESLDPGSFWADAHEVVLTDPLPTGLHATSVSSTQGSCDLSPAGDEVTCQLGTIEGTSPWMPPDTGGPAATVTVFGTIDPAYFGDHVVNEARVTCSSVDCSDDVDTATSNVPVQRQADLSLTKTADPAGSARDGLPVFRAGESIGYTLTAVNSGPSAAPGATITDQLPVGLSLDEAASPGCTVASAATADAGQVVTCPIAETIQVGEIRSFRIVALTRPSDSDVPRQVVNTARVALPAGSLITDPDASDDEASAGVWLDAAVDLTATASVSNQTPSDGNPVDFTFVMTNQGPSSAPNPAMEVTLPAGFTPDLTAVALPGGSCESSTSGDPAAYSLRCRLDQALDPGAQATLTVPGAFLPDTPPGNYQASVTVSIQPPVVETDDTNNQASVTVSPQLTANLRLSKDVAGGPIVAGGLATYQISVANAGPSSATGVVVSDQLPAGMSVVSATFPGGTCPAPLSDQQGPILRCPIGDLGVTADPVIITVVVAVDPAAVGREFCNTALAGSGVIDPDSSDNEGSAPCRTAIAAPVPDLVVTKLATPADRTLTAGSKLAYTLTFSNRGTAAAPVDYIDDLTDVLDDATVGSLAAGEGLTVELDEATGHLAITGEAAPGQTILVTYQAVVKDSGRGNSLLFNTAFPAATPEADRPNVHTPADQCLTCVTTPVAGISLKKEAEETTVSAAGDVVHYRFTVTNTGAVTIRNVSVVRNAFSGRGIPPTATCPATDVAPGGSLTCTASYTVVTDDLTLGQIDNTAVATASLLPDDEQTVTSSPSSATVLVSPLAPPAEPAPTDVPSGPATPALNVPASPSPAPAPPKPHVPTGGQSIGSPLLPGAVGLLVLLTGAGLLAAAIRRRSGGRR